MPVFLRAGCNVGGCHGAARGKDGFRLSLFGFDPDGDHFRLTRELNGRRINLAVPAESTAAREGDRQGAAHRRQRRSRRATSTTRRSIRWLEADAPLDPPTVAAAGEHGSVPAERRARRQGREAAARRPGEVHRRHRPRRDPPRAVPQQQRQRGEDRRRRHRDRRRARRGVRHGPVPHVHHRRAVHHAAEGRCSSRGRTRPKRTTSTRSSTTSSRSSASNRPASATTRRSSAACTSTSSACCRRPRSTPGSWCRTLPNKREQLSTNCSTARSSRNCGC